MEAFRTHTGTAMPLRRSNVDTDQILPASWLKRVSRTGFGPGLFSAWRGTAGFPLDDPAYVGATVLLAGSDFGTGSSREHAVWALQEHGFRTVISPRFGDIFRSNALKNGLLPVQLSAAAVTELMDAVEAAPQTPVTVDLLAREVRTDRVREGFRLDEDTRRRLIEGLDDVALTLRHADDISRFEQRRRAELPVTTRGGDIEGSEVPPTDSRWERAPGADAPDRSGTTGAP